MAKKQLLEQIESARQMSKISVGAGVELQFPANWNLICNVLQNLVEKVFEGEGEVTVCSCAHPPHACRQHPETCSDPDCEIHA